MPGNSSDFIVGVLSYKGTELTLELPLLSQLRSLHVIAEIDTQEFFLTEPFYAFYRYGWLSHRFPFFLQIGLLNKNKLERGI